MQLGMELGLGPGRLCSMESGSPSYPSPKGAWPNRCPSQRPRWRTSVPRLPAMSPTIVPACNANTSYDELEHIRKWATKNNLTLNRAKTKEILFRANVRPGDNTQIPPACQDIERVTSLVALGVIISLMTD